MKLLEQQVALITGGSRGIGRAIAELFLKEGAFVAICSRDSKELQLTIAELSGIGNRPVSVSCDVGTVKGCRQLFESVDDRFGKLDILVNNAGICQLGEISSFKVEQWDELMRINARAVFLCCQQAVKRMLSQETRGQIVNIASYTGIVGYPGVSAYCASKHAVMGLSRALAKELQPKGIRVSAICPREVDTRMRRNLFPKEEGGTWLKPWEVAEDVLFLVTRPFQAGVQELIIGLPQQASSHMISVPKSPLEDRSESSGSH